MGNNNQEEKKDRNDMENVQGRAEEGRGLELAPALRVPVMAITFSAPPPTVLSGTLITYSTYIF